MIRKNINKSFFEMYQFLWRQLPKRRRKELALILSISIFTSFTEFISIGAIVPFLAVLVDPESVFNNLQIKAFLDFFQIQRESDMIKAVTFFFIFATLFSSSIRFYLTRKSIKFNQLIGGDLAIEIYKNTLYMPYEEHTKLNSSIVISGVIDKVNAVVSNIFSPVLSIFTSLILIIGVLSVMFYANPQISFITLLSFSLIYAITLYLNKRRLIELGKVIDTHKNFSVKSLQEGFGGIREVIIDGTQKFYSQIFHKSDKKIRGAQSEVDIIATIPKFIVETSAIVIIVLIAYYLQGDKDFENIVPLMGLFALSGQKLMPLFQQIYVGLSSIKSGTEIFKSIYTLLERKRSLENNNRNIFSFNSEIGIQNMSFKFKSSRNLTLKKISLSIKKGEKVGIIGTTGSGKSTLVDIIMGLLFPSQNPIKVDNREISENNAKNWRANIAHVPQSIFLADCSVAENIAFGLPKDEIDFERVIEVAKLAFIHDEIEKMDFKYKTFVGERGIRLSGGQRQRIGIARALYKKASLIILDEATSALDSETEAKIMKSFENNSKEITLIIVAHRQSTLSNCDRIIEIHDGSIKREVQYEDL